MYSNSCCSCSFEPEIIKIGLSSHKMYSNNILKFPESTTILNAYTKKSGNLLKAPHMYRTLAGAALKGYSLHIPQRLNITRASPSDCLVYSEHLFRVGGLLLCRDAIGVFYSTS